MAKRKSVNFNTLRLLDRRLGIPLCNFFYLSKRIFFLHGRHKFAKEKIKKILVIKIWGMGSIIMASPVFQNLKDNFPEAEIWFLTKEGMENIYPRKFFDRIVTIKLKGLFSEVVRFFKLVSSFRREKFDLVIDLEIVSRYSALLSYLCGAKTKVGFEVVGQNKDRLYDFKALYHEGKHISQIFLGTLDAIGIDPKIYEPFAPEVSAEDGRKISELLVKEGITGGYVVININASEMALERRLPLGSFQEIIGHIRKDFPRLAIVLIGSKQESDYVSDFVFSRLSGDQNIHDLSGQLSLVELFALMKNSTLVISNDSGPAHVAATFKIPLIIFFGPETPAIYRPSGRDVSVFYADLYCSPCISVYKDKKISCANQNKCLKMFKTEEINQQVDHYLRRG
jgi:ADP-heptose:LPS heptosyltransferase